MISCAIASFCAAIASSFSRFCDVCEARWYMRSTSCRVLSHKGLFEKVRSSLAFEGDLLLFRFKLELLDDEWADKFKSWRGAATLGNAKKN